MAGTLTGYTRYIGVDINSLQVNLQKQLKKSKSYEIVLVPLGDYENAKIQYN